MMVSALTLLGLDEMMARCASYSNLADIIRHRFTHSRATLRELFSRIVFNILSGNTDDHARDHAAFWDGRSLSLTPAYDICPQGRSGQEATQAILIVGRNRASRISTCIEGAHQFLLSKEEAIEIAEAQTRGIVKEWKTVCDEAEWSTAERTSFMRRQFLNPIAFTDLDEEARVLVRAAEDFT